MQIIGSSTYSITVSDVPDLQLWRMHRYFTVVGKRLDFDIIKRDDMVGIVCTLRGQHLEHCESL